MENLTNALVYALGGYAAAYMVLRPSALLDALASGPGIGPAGWAFHHKHWKLTYPLLAGVLVLLGIVLVRVQGI